MAQITKQILSGSTDGKNISVVETASPGSLIHTALASDIDECYIYAVNADIVDVKLTIEYGGVANPQDVIEFKLPAEDGAYLIIPGWLLTNSLVIRAFAPTTLVIQINGFVNRIT